MKKLVILISAALFLLGCGNFQIPKTIAVKGDPVLKIPLGPQPDLLGFFEKDINTMLEDAVVDIDGLSVEQRALDPSDPDSPLRTHLIYSYDIQNIPFDTFAADELSLGSIDVDPFSEEKIIDPIAIEGVTSTVPMDINPTLTIPDVPLTVPESNTSVSATIPPMNISISGDSYTTVSYSAGSIIVSVAFSPATSGALLNITGANLTSKRTDTNSETASIGATSVPLNLSSTNSSGNLIFPLTGETLGTEFTVSMTGTTSGGTLGSTISLTMSTGFSGTTVSAAEGIDLTDFIPETGNVDIPAINLPAEVLEATLKTDSNIAINVTAPAGWTGVTYNYSFDLVSIDSLGTETVIDSAAAAPFILDMSGLTLKSGLSLRLDYSVAVSGTSATVAPGDFTVDAVVTLSDEIDAKIDATILDSLSQTINNDLSADSMEMLNLVDSVTFVDPNIFIRVINGFPVDISLNLSSTAFDLSDSFTYPKNSSLEVIEDSPLLVSTSSTLDLFEDGGSGYSVIDFNISVTTPSYDGSTDPPTMVIPVPTTGATFSFSGDAGLYSDLENTPLVEDYDNALAIKSAVINDWSLPAPGLIPEDYDGTNGIDLGSQLSMLDETVPGLNPQFQGITAYMDMDLSALANAGGNIGLLFKVSYDDSLGSHTERLISDGSGTDTMAQIPVTQEIINFPENIFDNMLNNRANNISMTYDASITGTTIEMADLTSGASIAITAVVDIPLQIALENPDETGSTELLDENGDPLLSLFEETDDMFKRESADSFADFLAMATGGIISLNFTNHLLEKVEADSTLSDPAVSFVIQEQKNGIVVFEKQFDIGLGGFTIELTSEDLAIMTNPLYYPFSPEFHIIVPDGLYFLGSGVIDLDSSYIEISSSVDYPVLGGDQ